MIEIGSEFHWYSGKSSVRNSVYKYLLENGHNEFYYSGRTIIDLIIRSHPEINKVFLPNYLCQSIIDPFINNDIEIELYNIYFENGILHCDCNNDFNNSFFLGINYFGSTFTKMDSTYEKIKVNNDNVVIIDDATQNMFSMSQSDFIDYQFCSIRKWLPLISGASLKNNRNKLNCKTKSSHLDIYDLKEKAMKLKRNYLYNNNSNEKELFMNLFKEFNENFSEFYKSRGIDEYSFNLIQNIDKEKICNIRKQNKIYLLNEINLLDKVNTLKFEKFDIPLFVPLFFEDINVKNEIKNILLKNEIYCPSHWPIPNYGDIADDQKLYFNEISLICDQRYELKHMKKIINVLKEGLNE